MMSKRCVLAGIAGLASGVMSMFRSSSKDACKAIGHAAVSLRWERIRHGAGIAALLCLQACGGGDGDDAGSSGSANSPPAAAAGADFTANERAAVNLDGSGSTDANGDALSYTWTQVDTSGVSVTLQNAGAKTADFVAPAVSVDTALVFRLNVSDGKASSTDDISVVIKPVTDAISIAVLGLGDDILVTDQASIDVQGLASSDAPITQVDYVNKTSGQQGKASGIAQWSTPITLVQGDNVLKFTALGADGKSAETTKVMTYYPNLALNTPLTLGIDVAYQAEATDVIVTLGVATLGAKTVTLIETDRDGAAVTDVATMLDDGGLPDEIESDGIYTGKASFTSSDAGYRCYRVKIQPDSAGAYFSENRCVWVTARYSLAQINKAVELADAAENQYTQALGSGKTQAQSAQAVLAALQGDASVATVGVTPEGGVWWVSAAGILGAYHPSFAQSNSKARSRSMAGKRKQAWSYDPGSKFKPAPTVSYPQGYLAHRSHYSPSARTTAATGAQRAHTLAAAADENRIGSSKAAIISPYIDNPSDPTNSFGAADDYYVPWSSVKNGNQCLIYPEKEALNNGSVGVTLEDFKNLSSFGYIHISSHGDNFYNGLLSLWEDEWGPNGWLSGSLSQVVLYSGIYLPADAGGNYQLGAYESDVQAKRIAIGPGGALALLPGFFARYLQSLPNSLVALSACRSTYNNSLANVFLSKGAGAVIGYTDYVKTSYAQNTLKTMLDTMYAAKTVGEAFDAAVSAHGSNDGDSDPAALTLVGAGDLTFGTGQFNNLGFETGNLTPWQTAGDGRVISKLGATTPTAGAQMGIISTGLGFTTSAGSIEQTACLAPTVKTLTFNWNFFSEEFEEYCGSEFQDAFKVELCEVSDGATGACQTIFDKAIDNLCNAVVKSDISFDQGDVYDTGWGSAAMEVTPFAGKNVKLKFSATDVGDSIYDSAILLDEIAFSDVN